MRLEGDIKGERIVEIATFADCCLAVSGKGNRIVLSKDIWGKGAL